MTALQGRSPRSGMSVLYIVTSNVTRIELLMTVLFWYRRACRLIEYGIGLADGVPPGAQATSPDRDRDCGQLSCSSAVRPFPALCARPKRLVAIAPRSRNRDRPRVREAAIGFRNNKGEAKP